MTKITIVPSSQNSTERPLSFTQVGGIYGTEIKPEEFLPLTPQGGGHYVVSDEIESVDRVQRESRFFSVK